MTSEEREQEIKQRLESIDALPADDVPSGWSRRNWVHREAVAIAALLSETPREEKK